MRSQSQEREVGVNIDRQTDRKSSVPCVFVHVHSYCLSTLPRVLPTHTHTHTQTSGEFHSHLHNHNNNIQQK
jgi:hypothetical protein